MTAKSKAAAVLKRGMVDKAVNIRSKRKSTKKRAPALAVPDSQVMLHEVLELTRRVPVDLHEDEIAHAYVSSFSRLFPQRLFCVRLFSSEDGSLSTVYANGRLDPARRHVRRFLVPP